MSFRREWLLLVSYGTVLAFSWYGDVLLAGLTDPLRLVLVLLWLFGIVLGSSLRVVAHADELAHRLGEPYGTLLLTLSVTFIEVMSIAAVMLHGENNPTLARDTMFAVVMIVLNGMVGLSLLMGGWRHREQVYNLQGANSYLGAIIPLVVLGLVLPSFTQTTPGPTLSGAQQVFLVVVSVGLYAAFLAVQTGRHHGFFSLGGEEAGDAARRKAPKDGGSHPILHAALLVGYLVPIVFLTEHLRVGMMFQWTEQYSGAVATGADRFTTFALLPQVGWVFSNHIAVAGIFTIAPISGGNARGDWRDPRRRQERDPALHQYLPGLRALDHRPHGAGDDPGDPSHRP